MSAKLAPVYVGMPNYMGMLHSNVVLSLIRLLNQETKKGRTIAFDLVPRVRAPKVRNQIARRFLAMKEFDYFLTIDDDHMFEMDALARLLQWMNSPNHVVDVIGALAFIRAPDMHTVLTPSMYSRIPNSNRYMPIDKWERDTLVRCDGMGMAFTLIRRKVLEALPQPWWWIPEEEGLGEDFYFCQKCRDKGFNLFVDTSVEAPHISGNIILNSSMYFDAMEEMEVQ